MASLKRFNGTHEAIAYLQIVMNPFFNNGRLTNASVPLEFLSSADKPLLYQDVLR